ncbi:MAG: hypothetical protein R3F49_04455 [Planctomycetota bacterium]
MPTPPAQRRQQALLVLLAATAAAAGGWYVLRAPNADRGAQPAPAAPLGGARALVPDAVTAAPTGAAGATASTVEVSPMTAVVPALDDNGLRWNEEGFRLLAAGDAQGAVERFEAASALWPEVDVYANNLAEALFRLARSRWEEAPDEALATLDRALLALRDDARRKELEPLRERWLRTRAAEDGFWTESSPYFAVSFDGTRVDLMNHVHEVLEDLDRYYGEYFELFGAGPVDPGAPDRTRTKLRVVFYARSTFDHVTGLGDWAGGVFDGTIRVPIESLADERERLRSVLRHELMHAFIQHLSASQAPAWLNEGLAQWIERPGEGRKLDVALARNRLRGHELFPLSELRGTLAAWSDREAIARAYAEALVLVDHLVYEKGEALTFALVKACLTGGPEGPEAYFLSRFPGYPLEEFLLSIPR